MGCSYLGLKSRLVPLSNYQRTMVMVIAVMQLLSATVTVAVIWETEKDIVGLFR